MGTANGITIARALLWTGAYFCLALLYTAINELAETSTKGQRSP